jgi:predicted esterase
MNAAARSAARFLRRHVMLALLLAVAVGLIVHRYAKRPRSRPLATWTDGPAPSRAAGVLFFFHGRGRGIGERTRSVVRALREAGLQSNVSVVLVEGPFSTWFGDSWGDGSEGFAESRARVRESMRELLGDHATAAWVVVAGFSQGAAIAADVAVEEPTVDAMASLSPCFMVLRGQLPKRKGLRVLLAHGTRDEICPVVESRSLAPVLEAAQVPVQYVEFDGGHLIPPEVVRALAALATPPP